MKNPWLDEIKIRNTATLVSESLSQIYEGKPVDMEAWAKSVLKLLEIITLSVFRSSQHRQQVRDAVLWRYTFQYQVDDQGNVISLKFVKLPWLI